MYFMIAALTPLQNWLAPTSGLLQAYITPAASLAESTGSQNTTCSQLDLAEASFSDQNDPVNPFTLFGNTR